MEKCILRDEERMNKHEVLAGRPVAGTLGATIIVGMCAWGVKERLELENKDIRYG